MGARLAMASFFLASALATDIVFLAACALCARGLRLAVLEYTLGIGPLLLRRGSFSLRLLPLSAWFNPATRGGYPRIDPESELATALARGRLRYFEDLPFLAFVGMTLIPVVVALVGTAACLGWRAAPEATLIGLRSYVAGALSPISAGRHLLDAAFADYNRVEGKEFAGRVLAVLGGVSVLWLPSSILFLLGVVVGRVWLRVRFFLWLVARATAVSWAVAFVWWALR
jgi:hypothetical protein